VPQPRRRGKPAAAERIQPVPKQKAAAIAAASLIG